MQTKLLCPVQSRVDGKSKKIFTNGFFYGIITIDVEFDYI